jgi:putative restriction endonuclease
LQKYGFGEAKEYFLLRNGRRYDSKAIVGAAHGFDFPKQGPLRPSDFSGGERTVQRKLQELGFEIVVEPKRTDWTPSPQEKFASERLRVGTVYTRKQLAEQFGITDATLNAGVFQPKGYSSVWLFVTEKKSADRTQYEDRLDGDTLPWQGQTEGRTDDLIIEHVARRLGLFF